MAVVVRAVAGALMGVVVLFFVVVATGAVAVYSNGDARVPGVFSASAGEENGAVALSFVPHGPGMVAVVVVVALLAAVAPTRRARHHHDHTS